jgi:hypothetical protein
MARAAKTLFEIQGFLSFDRITSQSDVTFIHRILEDLFARRRGFEEGALFDFAGAHDEDGIFALPQLLDPRSFAPALMNSEFVRNATDIARALLGPDARFAADHALVKPAIMGSATPWHQDEAFHSPDQYRKEISIWLPLQPVDRLNGCMSFIAGSHRGAILPHRSLAGDARIHALECYSGFDPESAIHCAVPAGGCTVHTSRTLHAAGPNKSAFPRFAYVLVFHGPAISVRFPEERPWLIGKTEPRLTRRRQWMRQGGVFVHSWRRMTQLKSIGFRETVTRLIRKLR